MSASAPERSYGRAPHEIRPTSIEPGFVRTASGASALQSNTTGHDNTAR